MNTTRLAGPFLVFLSMAQPVAGQALGCADIRFEASRWQVIEPLNRD